MKSLFISIFFLIFCPFTTFASNPKIDNIIEKVQQSNTKKEKKVFLELLKKELSQVNKKEREEANAIIKAKKKLPSKLFKSD